ncbi:MAG: PepSY-associated TM helix domain-containing protein [Pseudomonadota bacterium]
MGIVSAVWIFDCLVALWVSFPSAKSWRKSFAFRLRQGGAKLNFDLHRSGGVWLWGILLMLAVTSVSLNLGREVMKPVISVFSTVAPTPFEARKPSRIDAPVEPELSREQAIALAVDHVRALGWNAPPGEIFYAHRFGIYGVSFFFPERDESDDGMGNPWIYLDGVTGRVVSSKVPGTGSAGDVFMQAQLPLHSGRILGMPGRILISITGLAVATLSVTGVILWARKRRAKKRSDAARAAACRAA